MKQNQLTRIFKVSVFLIAVSIFSFAASGQNLLQNGGFEDYPAKGKGTIPENWVPNVDGEGEPGLVTKDSSQKRNGAYSVLIKRNGPGKSGRTRLHNLPLHVNAYQEYELSVYYMTGEDFQGVADVLVHGADIRYLHVPLKERTQPGEWKNLKFTFKPKETGTVMIFLQNKGIGSIWFDDISVKEIFIPKKAVSPELPLKQKVFIVKDGKALASIALPENCSQKEKKAAEYIKEYVRKATGADLKIASEKELAPGKNFIISVGKTELSKREEIAFDNLKYSSGRLITKNNILFIGGNDKGTCLGTAKAALTFLEKYIGIRWLIPSPDGEFIPNTNDIFIPENLDEIVRSDLAYVQHGPYPANGPGYIINNCSTNISIWQRGGHSWPYWVPVNKYYNTHPEYFALLNGARSKDSLNFLCTSNRDVMNIMADEMKKCFKKGHDWVQLGQCDGYNRGICQCPECRNLDNYKGDNSTEGLRKNPCERIFSLHVPLAEKCKKLYPDGKVLMLLYYETKMPPQNISHFPDNIVGEVAVFQFDEFKDVCEAWSGKINAFTAYLYWETTTCIPTGILPKITPRSVAEQIKYMRGHNVIGFYNCMRLGKNWGLWGPVYYTASKFFENPELDANELVKEYCIGIYGEKSGSQMKGFFDHLYSRIDKIKIEAKDFLNVQDEFLLYYPPYFVRQLENILQRAEKMAEDDRSRKWLMLTRTYFDYVKNVSYMLTAYQAYQAMPSRANVLQLKEKVADFEKYREQIFSYSKDTSYFPEYTFFEQFLSGIWVAGGTNMRKTYKEVKGTPIGYDRCRLSSPITLDFEKLLKNVDSEPQTEKMTANLVVSPPKLDGKLDDDAWKNAIPGLFKVSGGGTPDVKTLVRVFYTKDALFVGFECDEPSTASIKKQSLGRDGGIFNLDCVEILLDVKSSYSQYFHFIASPSPDAYYDARFGYIKDILAPNRDKEDRSWNPDWRYAFHIDKEKKNWSMEFEIPFKSLNVPTPSANSSWRVNFGRERYAGKNAELYLWSPSIGGGFCDISAFGELEFK